MAEGLLVQDHAGCILDCNTTAGTILGHPPERLRGMTLDERDWTLLREDGTPLSADDYPAATVLRMARPVRNLVLGILPSDAKGPARCPSPKKSAGCSSMPCPLAWCHGEQRGPAGVVTTFVDISAYVQAQKMMRESEEKLPRTGRVAAADGDPGRPGQECPLHQPRHRGITGYDLADIADPHCGASAPPGRPGADDGPGPRRPGRAGRASRVPLSSQGRLRKSGPGLRRAAPSVRMATSSAPPRSSWT